MNNSLDTLKGLFVKIVSQVIRDARDTWHDICTLTSIYIIQKSTRDGQKLGNKLPVNQAS